jgi:hypothetical protein
MAQEFLSDSTGSARPNSEPEIPKRERIQYMIVGSPEAVNEQIRKFHALKMARVDEWSPPQPSLQHPGEVITVLIRYRKPSSDSSTRKSGR